MNKVLIITYYWPPGSGAGVQRWLKFAKYLPAMGWEPVILTVDTEYAAYPLTDDSLSSGISPDLKIHRTRATDWFSIYKKDKTKIPSAGFAANDSNNLKGKIMRFIRGNFFIPDPRKGWNKFAFAEASLLIARGDISHIITTSPPHSTQLIGLKLKKCYPHITWIADLRDPWTDIYYYGSFYHTPMARYMDENFEKAVLKNADRIITVGKSLKQSFCKKVKGLDEKIEVITNGYDSEDFPVTDRMSPDVFTISYIGTLSDAYPVAVFIDALNDLAKRGFTFRLRFVGSVSSRQQSIIRSKSDSVMTDFLPYVNHEEAVRYMKQSSLLLLIIPDHHSNKSIITGKLFEYLASAKPVLCIGPADGDAAEIISSSGNGRTAEYSNRQGICTIIEEFYNAGAGTELKQPSEFTRENLTRKLAVLLNSKL